MGNLARRQGVRGVGSRCGQAVRAAGRPDLSEPLEVGIALQHADLDAGPPVEVARLLPERTCSPGIAERLAEDRHRPHGIRDVERRRRRVPPIEGQGLRVAALGFIEVPQFPQHVAEVAHRMGEHERVASLAAERHASR